MRSGQGTRYGEEKTRTWDREGKEIGGVRIDATGVWWERTHHQKKACGGDPSRSGPLRAERRDDTVFSRYGLLCERLVVGLGDLCLRIVSEGALLDPCLVPFPSPAYTA